MNEAIEKQIEQVLAHEGLNAQEFSQILFGLGGLFNELVAANGDRHAVANSPLCRRALERFVQLQKAEREAWQKAHAQASPTTGDGANNKTSSAESKPLSEQATD